VDQYIGHFAPFDEPFKCHSTMLPILAGRPSIPDNASGWPIRPAGSALRLTSSLYPFPLQSLPKSELFLDKYSADVVT